MYVQRFTATDITVTGSGNTAVTTITVPGTVTLASGCIYDILLTSQVPSETNGTIVNISNGTQAGSILQRCSGNYARARGLGWRKVLRVQWFEDPDHFMLLGVRG